MKAIVKLGTLVTLSLLTLVAESSSAQVRGRIEDRNAPARGRIEDRRDADREGRGGRAEDRWDADRGGRGGRADDRWDDADRGGRGGRNDNRGEGRWDESEDDFAGNPRWGNRRPGRPHPPREELIEIYRFFNHDIDHLLTVDYDEGVGAGFTYEMVAFKTFASRGANRVPLFRCYDGRQHFASKDRRCEGHQQEGNLGFVAERPEPRVQTAIVRCYNGVKHLVTVDQNECVRNGFRVEGALGYIR